MEKEVSHKAQSPTDDRREYEEAREFLATRLAELFYQQWMMEQEKKQRDRNQDKSKGVDSHRPQGLQ